MISLIALKSQELQQSRSITISCYLSNSEAARKHNIVNLSHIMAYSVRLITQHPIVQLGIHVRLVLNALLNSCGYLLIFLLLFFDLNLLSP